MVAQSGTVIGSSPNSVLVYLQCILYTALHHCNSPVLLTREVLEWPYTVGGGWGTPHWTPPPQTKVTKGGWGEIYRWENLVEPFLVPKVWVPDPPPPPQYFPAIDTTSVVWPSQ